MQNPSSPTIFIMVFNTPRDSKKKIVILRIHLLFNTCVSSACTSLVLHDYCNKYDGPRRLAVVGGDPGCGGQALWTKP